MHKKLSFNRKALALLGASFLIPLCILVGCIYLLKMAPFGEDSLLLIDASSQYVNYLSYFRSVLTGECDLLYTFSKNLGGDLLSLAAYYMLSPFNLLFLLFDIRFLPLAFTAVMVLKLSCCGLTYYYASSRFFGHRLSNLAFSTAYALMGYTVIYEWNLMWLDGVLILPLLFLGLYRLVTEEKIGLYAVSIAYALITSFYTGYMLCAASVLFFPALVVITETKGKKLLRRSGCFVYGSCMGGFGAAVVWLPAVLKLAGNRVVLGEKPNPLALKTNLADFTAKFLPGSANTMEIYEGMPHVFCTTLVLLLVILFFLNRGISRRMKLTALSVIGVFLVSFCITGPDIAWHGFSPNRLFNFRYSFLFSFVLILTAQYSLHKTNQPRGKQLLLPTAVILALAFTALIRRPDLALPGIFLTLASLGSIFLACLSPKRFFALALTLIAITEAGLNCGLTWQKMCSGTLKLNARDFYYYVDSVEPGILAAKRQEEGFYRIEKTFFKDQNDPMLFAYNGLSHFSSTEPAFLMEFLEKMGLRNYFDVWSAYLQGSTADADALLGVRYLLSWDDEAALKGYELVDSPYGIGLYRNPNALPLATLANNALRNVSAETEDHFAFHNAIWSGLTGQAQNVLLKETSVKVTQNNLTETLREDGTYLYTKTDPSQNASLCFTLTISKALPLYYYFTAPVQEQNVSVRINGEPDGEYFNAFRWNMANAGIFTPGETVTVELIPNTESFVFDKGWFYYEDHTALANAAAAVKETPVSLTQISASRFEGHFETDTAKTLFFTIPWDAGWHMVLDDREVSMDRALDTFLSVSVPAGAHSFRLYFLPQGLTVGIGLTVLSGAMALLWLLIHRQEKQN